MGDAFEAHAAGEPAGPTDGDGSLLAQVAASPSEELLVEACARVGLEGGLLLHAMADRLCMSQADLSCLLLLGLEGPSSAGRLADRTGLTSGAITGVVDRLARAGWVERRADPGDRRRVVVALAESRTHRLREAFGPFAAAALRAGGAAAPAERLAFVGTIDALATAYAAEVDRVRRPLVFVPTGPSAGGGGTLGVAAGGDGGASPLADPAEEAGPFGAGVLGTAAAILRVKSWSGPLHVRPADTGASLARRVNGPPAEVRVRNGAVTIAPARGRWSGPLGVAAEAPIVEVHEAVAWDVEVTGGANRVALALAGLTVRGVTVTGGANRVRLALPAPSGAVPVRIAGGANRVTIYRPAGAAVTVAVRRGAHDVRVDGTRLSGARDLEWSSPGAGVDRYEIEVTGGASKLTVAED